MPSPSAPVAVLQLADPLSTLRDALELCGGFERLRTTDRVLLKPNICVSEWMPPFGMVTTTALLEALVQLLAEHGCRSISIGEGPVDVFGLTMARGYRRHGIARLAKRFGVALVDLNRGPFRSVDLDGHTVQIARAVEEHDFLINVPALKTHNQVKVSLGFKNLKGVLSPASKTKFHGTRRLEHLIKRLNDVVRPQLTVLDGTYALERGPDTVLGDAYRTNLLVASTDAFAVDVVGATLLGIDPSEVGHLKEHADDHQRPLSVRDLELVGETDLGPLTRKLAWKADVVSENPRSGRGDRARGAPPRRDPVLALLRGARLLAHRPGRRPTGRRLRRRHPVLRQGGEPRPGGPGHDRAVRRLRHQAERRTAGGASSGRLPARGPGQRVRTEPGPAGDRRHAAHAAGPAAQDGRHEARPLRRPASEVEALRLPGVRLAPLRHEGMRRLGKRSAEPKSC
ncbi:MAG: DUF362 domain-containing protein [Myxococcales bacterium]